MNALMSIYQNEYDVETDRALILLGGKSNQSKVAHDVEGMIQQAKDLVSLTNDARRVQNDQAQRFAIEKVREKAVLICSKSCHCKNGTRVLIPKDEMNNYTSAVLTLYEEMMSYLDWYYDLSGETS